MIHRQFKGHQVIGGMLPLVFYPFEQLSQIIVGNGFPIRKTTLGSVFEVLDVNLMVFFMAILYSSNLRSTLWRS